MPVTDVPEHIQRASSPLWDLIWAYVGGMLLLLISAMGVLLRLLWSKTMSEIKQNKEAIEHMQITKAEKDDVEKKHEENKGSFKRLEEGQDRAEVQREALNGRLATIDMSLGLIMARVEWEKVRQKEDAEIRAKVLALLEKNERESHSH